MAAAKAGGRRIGRAVENGRCLQHGRQRIVVCIETIVNMLGRRAVRRLDATCSALQVPPDSNWDWCCWCRHRHRHRHRNLVGVALNRQRGDNNTARIIHRTASCSCLVNALRRRREVRTVLTGNFAMSGCEDSELWAGPSFQSRWSAPYKRWMSRVGANARLL